MEIQFSQFVPGLSSTLGAVLQNPRDVAAHRQPAEPAGLRLREAPALP